MRVKREHWILLTIIFVYLILVTAPYLYAWLAAGEGHVFSGLLINLQDGNSYLAKMRQGYNGSWSLKLPYTYAPGEGSYIMMFYLLLGHIARLLNWSLVFTYHFARVVGAVVLLLALYKLCKWIFPRQGDRWLAFILAAFGSGMGWLAALFGQFTTDLWVAEAYPFLAGYATPHFAFGQALQITLFIYLWDYKPGWRSFLFLALASLALALISPFAIMVTGAVGIGLMAWETAQKRDWQPVFDRLVTIGLFSGPVLFYDFWLSKSHPVLSLWHAQNLTVSPALWDLLLSLSPALPLAFWGLWLVLQRERNSGQALGVWLVVCLLLVYFPFSLQRRFLHGLYIPVALLAVIALVNLGKNRVRTLLTGVVLVFSLTTNLVVLLSAVFGVRTLDNSLYLSRGEYLALEWLNENTPAGALLLAAPDTGLFVPVYTSDRVLYGHPYETVHAGEMERLVTGFYTNEIDNGEVLAEYPVEYIFYGPREKQLGEPKWLTGKSPVYDRFGVQIFAVKP
jgi:hypothetical protein